MLEVLRRAYSRHLPQLLEGCLNCSKKSLRYLSGIDLIAVVLNLPQNIVSRGWQHLNFHALPAPFQTFSAWQGL